MVLHLKSYFGRSSSVAAGFALTALLALLAWLPGAEPAAAQGVSSGRLVIMGGGGFGEQANVYGAILEARHGEGPVCVIPTASAAPESSIASAVSAFDRHGGEGTAVGIPELVVDDPQAAHDPAVVAALERCSGFYFVGGVQSRIVALLRPDGRSTPALEVVMRRYHEGAVASGTSAGAAIMSDPMIGGGASGAMAGGIRREASVDADDDASGAGDGLSPVQVQPGLGFFPAALVDQHFLARGRIGRLLVAVLEMPEFDLGFGIDESTALVVEGTAAWPVGASGVVIVDAAGARSEGGVATGVRLHLMSEGDRFDLATRRMTPAAAKRELPPAAPPPPPEDLFSSWTFFHVLEAFGRSAAASLPLPVPGGRLMLGKSPDFTARGGEGEGVQGTSAGLSLAGLTVELYRDR